MAHSRGWLLGAGGGEEASVALHAHLSTGPLGCPDDVAPASAEQARGLPSLMLPPPKSHTPSRLVCLMSLSHAALLYSSWEGTTQGRESRVMGAIVGTSCHRCYSRR